MVIRSIMHLFSVSSLVSYEWRELWLSLALGIILGALTLSTLIVKIRSRQLDKWDGLFGVFFVYSLLCFLAPRDFSGFALISPRLSLYAILAIILWLGAQSYLHIVRRGVTIAVTAITLLFLGFHTVKYAEIATNT